MTIRKQYLVCEKCGRPIKPGSAVWLELSITDGNYYYKESFPKNHESQGFFIYGSDCAKKVAHKTN